MKQYFVLVKNRKLGFMVHTNSLKLARWLADLKIWKYAKIYDTQASDEIHYFSKCIYIKDRRKP